MTSWRSHATSWQSHAIYYYYYYYDYYYDYYYYYYYYCSGTVRDLEPHNKSYSRSLLYVRACAGGRRVLHRLSIFCKRRSNTKFFPPAAGWVGLRPTPFQKAVSTFP